MLLPQLQVREKKVGPPLVGELFRERLRAHLRRGVREELRVGIVVDGEQWVLDLGHGFVAGGGEWCAVDEAPVLDLLLRLTRPALECALTDGRIDGSGVEWLRGTREDLDAFLRVLSGVGG